MMGGGGGGGGGGIKTTFSRKDVKDILGIDRPTSATERQQMFDDWAACEFVQSGKRSAKRSTEQRSADIGTLSRRINELLEQGCM
jgi:hypothetical protein